MSWRQHDTATSHYVDSTHEAGLRLHLRAHGDDPARAPVLFVHGATYASRLYDIPHPGASWLKATARARLAAYALDIRGYGRSRSAAMEAARTPYARADDAIRDIDDAVNWITARHGGVRVAMVGGSWGSITSGLYASVNAAKLARLVLYAPIYAASNDGWLQMLRSEADPARFNPRFAAYRLITEAGTRERWDAEMPAGSTWRDEPVFQALVQASLADDPEAARHTPPAFRAPNGTLMDLWEAFNGRAVYDASAIRVPVMLIRGTQDPTSTRADALSLFDALTSAEDRSYVEIANGTHFVSAEHRAQAVFAAVNGYLAPPVAIAAEGAVRRTLLEAGRAVF